MTLPRRRLLPAALALPLLALAPAQAQTPTPTPPARVTAGDIAIEQPWARAAIQGGTGGVFLTIRNTGQAPDRLVSASSPLPQMTELHTSFQEGDVMRMRAVQAVEIPPGGSVTLRPGGLHLMLVRLSRPMPVGGTVPVTLQFERAGAVAVQVPILSAGATGPQAPR